MSESQLASRAKKPLISVVVCSYDRPRQLAVCLDTLSEQQGDRDSFEVIVVDNKPDDSTRQLVDRYRSTLPILYIAEPVAGLSHARNRGWRLARGEYVAFVDDDCKVPREWLRIAMRIVRDVSPTAFGGPYYTFYDSPKPPWFLDRYASHEQGTEGRLLDRNEYLDGANMAFRRSVLADIGGFDAKLGMSGAKTAYGEETDLLRRIRRHMPDASIHYEPALYVQHLVRADKMQLGRIALQQLSVGRSTARVFRKRVPVGRWRLVLIAIGTVSSIPIGVVRALLARDPNRFPCWQNYFFERVFPKLQTLGGIREQWARASVDEHEPLTLQGAH